MTEPTYGPKELEFAIFCIENVAAKLKVDTRKVYAALTEQTDIVELFAKRNNLTLMSEGISDMHRMSDGYLVEELEDEARNKK